jgi:hypothetical protein
MDSALSSIVVRTGGVEGVEDLLVLHYRCLSHPLFSILSMLYPSLFEKVNKKRLVCDACELDKHIRSTYVRSNSRSSCFLSNSL